jgi:YD repeat-containing protein
MKNHDGMYRPQGAEMKIARIMSLAAVSFLTATAAEAQQTTTYAYDALGRVTNAGRSDSTTNYYVYDNADNRLSVRCCTTVGGLQVKDDGFDPYFYLQTYADIRNAGVDPYQHWLAFGASENRWPNRYFNTAWYRSTYGIASGTNPLTEYHVTGWQAGRNPSPGFSTALYHSVYPDTAAIDPLEHFLRWGYGEGRSAFAVP